MRVCILFSGGKDSHLAMLKVMRFHKVECLVSIISENEESYMFHVPNIGITKIQAIAMNTPIIMKRTLGEKEKELIDLKNALKIAKEKYNIEGVVSGAIRSKYQYSRIQSICKELNLHCLAPLWLLDEIKLLNEVKNKLHAIITGVFSFPLKKEFLGRKLDDVTIQELIEMKNKFGINITGEGGDFETTVLDAPFYKKKLIIKDFDIEYENWHGIMRIKEIEMIEK